MNNDSLITGLIKSIKHELSLDKSMQSTMANSFWFYSEMGVFLYMDAVLNYEVAQHLIKDKTLYFKGFENNQGIKMSRYIMTIFTAL